MSHPQKPKPALFFIAETIADERFKKNFYESLEERLGMVILQSMTYEFSKYTSYYEREMGAPLHKTIYFFENLQEPEFLVELKHLTYGLEMKLAQGGARVVNLDPGYLTLAKVVLATFKDYAHRAYLGRFVFAEVEYIYRDGSFQPLIWTYPDYREPGLIRVFNKAREFYKGKLRCLLTE